MGKNLSGVGVYSQEILRSLPAAHPGPDYLFCYRPHRYLRAPASRRTLLTPIWPRRIDLFHSLNQRVDASHYRHVVATFHDLFVISGEYSTMEFRKRFEAQARQAAGRSDLIIAVSEFTASQIEALLGISRGRIRVIHHGVHAAARVLEQKREKTILFVGAIQKRKNVERLVRAFERTPAAWKLVLAGSSGYGAEHAMRTIEASARRGDILVQGYVTRARLEQLYGLASIFAFPSLDEGFGMPVLDAMARGVPVLTSNGSALREVAANAALLVDPYDEHAIAEGLNRLIQNEDFRSQLAVKGLERSATFTWERAMEKTWDVYRELLF